MARTPMTPEQREQLAERLRIGRETAALRRREAAGTGQIESGAPARMETGAAPGNFSEKGPVEAITVPRKRIPFAERRKKLDATGIPGYKLHWVNDIKDRIITHEEAGYEFVNAGEVKLNSLVTAANADLGTRVSKVVGTKENGEPMHAYLMKIKQEWYDEDQQAKQALVDESDKALRGGFGISGADNSNFYGGVKVGS